MAATKAVVERRARHGLDSLGSTPASLRISAGSTGVSAKSKSLISLASGSLAPVIGGSIRAK